MNKRVLLCDDEVHILKAAEFKIRRAGHDVECVSDGEQAWEAIGRQLPDVVVTDCQMPRLDGIGLCRRVRAHEHTRHLPMLMLTAKGYELSHEDVVEQLHILRVIAKPFSPRELLQIVEEVLATGTLSSAHAATE